jgi:hypothetical protein
MGADIWEYQPELLMKASMLRFTGTDGNNVQELYPVIETYSLKIRVMDDITMGDLIGININLSSETHSIVLYWNQKDNSLITKDSLNWIEIIGETTFIKIAKNYHELSISMRFTWRIPDNTILSGIAVPVSNNRVIIEASRNDFVKIHTSLQLYNYEFNTSLQSTISPGDWIFGITDITVSNFSVCFTNRIDLKPTGEKLWITFSNIEGFYKSIIWIEGNIQKITIPISGLDGDTTYFWLNLSTDMGDILWSKRFQFKRDIDPPSAPLDVKIRNDGYDDEKFGIDNDPEVYVTWGGVKENGSGLKGLYYSVNSNEWPKRVNYTDEYFKILLKEGRHTLYIWAEDNTSRISPFSTAEIIIDDHSPVFFNPIITNPINTTDREFTYSIWVQDILSGLDTESIQYVKTLEDGSISEWQVLDKNCIQAINNHQENKTTKPYKISLTLDLILKEQNIVNFRARDIANTGWKESPFLVVYFDPDLASPLPKLVTPLDKSVIEGEVFFSWECEYINLKNVTYQIILMDPDMKEHVINVNNNMSYSLQPNIPGTYQWFVRAIADGIRVSSDTSSFEVKKEMFSIKMDEELKIKINEIGHVRVEIKNPLLISSRISFALSTNWDIFEIVENSSVNLGPNSSAQILLGLKHNGVSEGKFTVKINISDKHRRYIFHQLNIEIDNNQQSENEKDDNNILYIIIGTILGFVLVAIIIVFIFGILKKSRSRELSKEEKEIWEKFEKSKKDKLKLLDGLDEERKKGSNILIFDISNETTLNNDERDLDINNDIQYISEVPISNDIISMYQKDLPGEEE